MGPEHADLHTFMFKNDRIFSANSFCKIKKIELCVFAPPLPKCTPLQKNSTKIICD